MMELKESHFPEKYNPVWESLKTDDDYGKTSFELLKEVSMTVTLLVSTIPDTPFKRNEAIRRALIKRLSLLGKSLLSDVSCNSGYQQLQITRQIFEIAANYIYLSGDDEKYSRHSAFINQSLAEEKDNLTVIASKIKERGGDTWPIEERMRKSIERVAEAAGVGLDSVPSIKQTGWPNSFERLKEISSAAYPAYRGSSSALHGGWSTLLLQDLTRIGDDSFSLERNDSYAKVQTMSVANIIIAETAIHYLEHEGTDIEKEWFLSRLEDLRDRARKLDNLHEKFMQTD